MMLFCIKKVTKKLRRDKMAREKREWHEDFKKYMEFIVKHPNYSGMPELYNNDGSIRWVVTGKSTIGKKRKDWWKNKADELGINTVGKWISQTAKQNHPTKEKVCQTCGRKLSIEYVYPTKNLVKRINKISQMDDFNYNDFKHIKDIIHEILTTLKDNGFNQISKIFSIPKEIQKTEVEYWNYIYKNFVQKESRKLSPGAMSNAPDRLDGFHTYNICCRSKQDTGRHASNLERYIEDRRAYMHWSEGDWKSASWLMKSSNGICAQCGNEGKVTADHIGPISLGFSHLPVFQPFCKSCNSAKNNRMFLKDVLKLIKLENQGKKVVSWHSKYIWDNLKYKVETENDAKKLSKLMRKAHHQFLEFFYNLSSLGYKDFLLNYLNPEYAFYEKIEFKNLNPSTYEHDGVIKIEGTKKNYQNNATRYIRIAFKSLDEYHKKKNRKIIGMTPSIEFTHLYHQIVNELKIDTNYNKKLREYINTAFDEKVDSEIQKKLVLVLDEYENKPYKNKSIEEKINKALRINADVLIKQW